MKHTVIFLVCILTITTSLFAQDKSAFQLVPLGVKGGLDETNLSAYLVAPTHSNAFVCLDAGTINAGITKAIENNVFKASSTEVLQQYIKGYLISHAHLDHVSGLIINSPADASKTVYATNACMTMMQNHYFNGETWANFGDEGPGYQIKRYHFQTLKLKQEIPLSNTDMMVTAFPLSHVNPFESTAFLIRHDEDYILYLGDTGPDTIENSDDLKQLWTAIAPLIKSKKLRAMLIEVSFPNEQADTALFGHLTTDWFYKEMKVLQELTGEKALTGFKTIITHQKPPIENMIKIKTQLEAQNSLGLDLIFPEQGVKLEL
ncbi:MBL fold metallo-hydrolase [Formosa algae]|uniref:3',5'-cyclic-nucleotide phosphodiesterase n=1 Tax=Formosa algae TaxID=225843 RepID=A0A9X1CC74_9FLAO|nr:3',5'-cyclic-nucleotide phosphodiesterase [Formosa algae]MBP1839960.1 3',5'-cyclic-nucleotide phosphodiesterase [Formosa algae]MDQ0335559.1 3',5'-cyclic-nucleotide phosphodiesterase [Formosa algae]OEI81742.1 3',5'-cyclic-nucleotide phosphodiesterase [Formosa algae]